jgi:hypothetical protein
VSSGRNAVRLFSAKSALSVETNSPVELAPPTSV